MEGIENNSVKNDDDRLPSGLNRLVTGQTKSFKDTNSEIKDLQSYRSQPFDVRTVPGQLIDDDMPTQRHVTDTQTGARPIDNNSKSQNQNNNIVTLKNLPLLEQFQNQFEDHSCRVLYRDFEDFVNQVSDNQKLDKLIKVDVDDSFKNESHFELKEPTTVIKNNRPRVQDPEVFERTGPDGFMNETSSSIRLTVQNDAKLVIDSPDTQDFDRIEKRIKNKHPPLSDFCRIIKGNIGEDVRQNRQTRNNQNNYELQRRHSIGSVSSVPMSNIVSDDGNTNAIRWLQQKKKNKNVERYHNRNIIPPFRHSREREEDYFYEEEEDNVSPIPDVESGYRSHISRSHQFKHNHPNNPHKNNNYYGREDFNYRNRLSSRTDSGYCGRYSTVSVQDCMAQIEILNSVDRKNYLLKFRERDPVGYTEWYGNYKTNVNILENLLSRTKPSSQWNTSKSTQSHNKRLLNQALNQERVINRIIPPRYPNFHINVNMSMAFGKLFIFHSSNATLKIIKISPDPDDTEAAELYRFPSPFVLRKTHKTTVSRYLNNLVEEVSNNSERLLYELISLMIKRNGIVDSTDISEMLMENVAKYPVKGILFESKNTTHIKEMSGESINHFRNLLLQGNKCEALEFAIQSQNWGLAFVLVLYTDKTCNYIKTKFFQTIPPNDTLQTFFQLNNGKIPSCSAWCADSTWGDWREHLAMILSNQIENVHNAYKATLQLGDTLAAKGDIFGAHFCYLTSYQKRVKPVMPTKFTLLGTSSDQPFNTSTSNRVILITSAFEFAIRLNNSNFFISSLLPYKYLLAVRLAEYGECEYALQHLEAIATQIIAKPNSVNIGFVYNIVDLGTDLQMSNVNLSRTMDTLDWLEDLKLILANSDNNYNAVNNVLPTQHVEQQTNLINHLNGPIEQKIILDFSGDHSAPQEFLPRVKQSPTVNPHWQPSAVSQPIIEPPLQAEFTQYYDVLSTSGVANIYNNQNEMTSEISRISPDPPLAAVAPEKTISTELKFGVFDRQMAEFDPKAIGEYVENDSAPQQAAPPMDSESHFKPVANSSPANQTHNQLRTKRKTSNGKQMENVLTPDTIFQSNQSQTTLQNNQFPF